ncbi:DEAD/DEAH box helicase [Marinifilum sp. D714]|uniref:DEAD/DEAH box helicase n=1 Tax=Marinifilum sp. D714 TaxID=2937523 RepID=UPI0027CAE0E8|nr:DEAD/DEAH box helicase [Marinifilum sp. D714]MDQ2178478.1 DEAD/DEAH box helicase [Marinifilum sp. D714]
MQIKTEDILKRLGIQKLNEMQNVCAKSWVKSNDLILLSPTGSGKTLAFLLPMLKDLDADQEGVQALILSPARELSLQIESVFKDMGTSYKVNCCYGGHSMRIEKNNLQNPPSVLIGTPGRVADHIRRENFDTSGIKFLILDEFDKALELGFQKEMTEVIKSLPRNVKKVLTSATQGIEIPEFARMNSPKEINFLPKQKAIALTQRKVMADDKDKLDALYRLICTIGDQPGLVFCNHRDAVERIADLLKEQNISCDIFHGGLEQADRERALIKFRNGSNHLLITTDLASRGLDIPEIQNVIHYQLPKVEEAFIHRNGRTARMHAKGNSFIVLAEEEKVPEFISDDIPVFSIKSEVQIPNAPIWETLYIGLGKKEKINKVDLVGFFFKKGNLQKNELGKIDVLDHTSFVAVKRGLGKKLVNKLKNERVKKKKIKIQVSR